MRRQITRWLSVSFTVALLLGLVGCSDGAANRGADTPTEDHADAPAFSAPGADFCDEISSALSAADRRHTWAAQSDRVTEGDAACTLQASWRTPPRRVEKLSPPAMVVTLAVPDPEGATKDFEDADKVFANDESIYADATISSPGGNWGNSRRYEAERITPNADRRTAKDPERLAMSFEVDLVAQANLFASVVISYGMFDAAQLGHRRAIARALGVTALEAIPAILAP